MARRRRRIVILGRRIVDLAEEAAARRNPMLAVGVEKRALARKVYLKMQCVSACL
jgi:hypothetical protein